METVLRAAALCVIGCVLTQLLKKDVPALQLLLTLGVLMVLFLPAAQALTSVATLLRELAELAGVAGEHLAVVLKCAAVAAVVKLGGDLCRDAGQSALATAMELTGAVTALILTMPLLLAVLEMVMGI